MQTKIIAGLRFVSKKGKNILQVQKGFGAANEQGFIDFPLGLEEWEDVEFEKPTKESQ